MSEEQILMGVEREKGILEYFLNHGWISEWKKDDAEFRKDAIQGLLDLYNKEKEKNKRYEKSLLYMINQFAYDEKRNKQEDEILYTGGLGALEEAFDVLNINEGIQRKDLWKMIQELLEEKEH